MEITLNKPFARNGKADEADVLTVKRALNRLGYYQPYEKIGITEIPDAAIFDALKKFQQSHGLKPTGEAKPGDETITTLADKIENAPNGNYIWRTVEDDKVRASHEQYNRTTRAWSGSPNPGEDENCRCWAEPIKDGINPVYPELFLIPASKIGSFIKGVFFVTKTIKEFYKENKIEDYTQHGNLRASQREISSEEIQEAIKTAKETKKITEKIGKYGTTQIHYEGSNGVTVVEETSGRNAGKIITVWRKK